jgi:hypothetical protein
MIKLTAKNYRGVVHRQRREWPKYSTQLLNVAGQNAKIFDSAKVGHAKETWLEMRGKGIRGTFENWCNFYNSKPFVNNIPGQAQKLYEMIQKMQVGGISLEMCEDYIKEVIYNKTHMGMAGEEMAVEAVGQHLNKPVRFSTAEEESQGIDGWVGEIPVQVKPNDSVFKGHVHNHPDRERVLLVTYEAKKQVCYIHNPEFLTKFG